jgi:hypothetical protein
VDTIWIARLSRFGIACGSWSDRIATLDISLPAVSWPVHGLSRVAFWGALGFPNLVLAGVLQGGDPREGQKSRECGVGNGVKTASKARRAERVCYTAKLDRKTKHFDYRPASD